MVTSEPSGALVTVNDVEIGRTPVEAAFDSYGTYDVSLTLPGHEPIRTSAPADAPWYEFLGPDIVATALPTRVLTTVKWHFTLEPTLEATQSPEEFESGLIERARGLRTRLAPAPSPDSATPEPR